MALPTVVGVGTAAGGIGDVVPTLPTGWAADDIHLCVVSQSAVNNYASAPVSDTNAWALVTDSQQKAGTTATDGIIQVFWRRAVAGDTAPTVTDTINHTEAQIIGIRGCIATGDPWDVTSGGTDAVVNTALSVTGDTTTIADCLIVYFYGHGVDALSVNFSSEADATLANFAARMDFSHAGGNGGGFGCSTGELASAGAYGPMTATLASGSTKAFCSIALKPPAVGGGATWPGFISPFGW